MRTSHSKLTGFTLIELLIVVAIIGILAAIAIPNFLLAQTRAKVARVKSDMRTVGVALETYQVDCNLYPDWNAIVLGFCLTTPVPYLSNFASTFTDPFAHQLADVYDPINGWLAFYNYFSTTWWDFHPEDGPKPSSAKMCLWYPEFPEASCQAQWALKSFGPWGPNPPWIEVPYDPSNGTISLGKMMRFGP